MTDINFLTEQPSWRNELKLHRALWKSLVLEALQHAPADLPDDIAVNILLADDAEVHRLNRDYRDMDKPTNILSFPQVEDWSEPDLDLDEALEMGEGVLGDLVLGWGVVEKEAQEQNKSIRHHVGHLLVHGTLHLLGYDHLVEDEAESMEALETAILAAHDIPDPYTDNNTI